MGDRAQILVEDTGVYLYTHSHGFEIEDLVRRALAHRTRWDDPPYLTRMIADQVSAAAPSESRGAGISTEKQGDIHTLVRVSCSDRTVMVEPQVGGTSRRYSFEEFIAH